MGTGLWYVNTRTQKRLWLLEVRGWFIVTFGCVFSWLLWWCHWHDSIAFSVEPYSRTNKCKKASFSFGAWTCMRMSTYWAVSHPFKFRLCLARFGSVGQVLLLCSVVMVCFGIACATVSIALVSAVVLGCHWWCFPGVTGPAPPPTLCFIHSDNGGLWSFLACSFFAV